MTTERLKLVASFVAGLIVMAVAFIALGGDAATNTATYPDTNGDIVSDGGAFSDTTLVSPQAADQDEAGQDEPGPNEVNDEPVSRFSDLPPIVPGDLPPEALDTLSYIASGGPYPFDKDDSTFQNREGYLPDFPIGHYREYTVVTPGESDRGARRIVAGEDGELYYTSDHYNSFSEIVVGS